MQQTNFQSKQTNGSRASMPTFLNLNSQSSMDTYDQADIEMNEINSGSYNIDN